MNSDILNKAISNDWYIWYIDIYLVEMYQIIMCVYTHNEKELGQILRV